MNQVANSRTNQVTTNHVEQRGHSRNFATVFLLGLLTLGIYFMVWSYQAFKEVDQESGQDHRSGLWVAGLLLSFFFVIPGMIFNLIYFFTELGQLGRARQAAGMKKGITGGTFVLAMFLSYIVFGIGSSALLPLFSGVPIAVPIVVFLLMLLVMVTLPYYLVQKSINQYWAR